MPATHKSTKQQEIKIVSFFHLLLYFACKSKKKETDKEILSTKRLLFIMNPDHS
jgi:hypothetical protein